MWPAPCKPILHSTWVHTQREGRRRRRRCCPCVPTTTTTTTTERADRKKGRAKRKEAGLFLRKRRRRSRKRGERVELVDKLEQIKGELLSTLLLLPPEKEASSGGKSSPGAHSTVPTGKKSKDAGKKKRNEQKKKKMERRTVVWLLLLLFLTRDFSFFSTQFVCVCLPRETCNTVSSSSSSAKGSWQALKILFDSGIARIHLFIFIPFFDSSLDSTVGFSSPFVIISIPRVGNRRTGREMIHRS